MPFLWILALQTRLEWLGVGVLAAGISDFLDGWLARRKGQTSRLGSQLDSIADSVFFASAVCWGVYLYGAQLASYLPLVILLLVLNLASLLVGLFRRRRWGDLHRLSSKAAAVVVFLFLVALCWMGFISWLFWLAMGTYLVCILDSLACQLRA